jgi:hypothetical protein
MSRITNDPNLAHEWEVVGDVIATRTSGEMPVDAWDGFIHDLVSQDVKRIFSLVVGPATMSANQRKHGADTFRARNIEAVVVTDHRMTRGILTALSWLGANIKGYSWADLGKALEYVSRSPEQRLQLEQIAERCRQELE